VRRRISLERVIVTRTRQDELPVSVDFPEVLRETGRGTSGGAGRSCGHLLGGRLALYPLCAGLPLGGGEPGERDPP